MNERGKIESEIRDWLSVNLNFIAPNLTLIAKEYYLTDQIGASGFVDLLCKDDLNNFVVIEIKRSEASARQTISEILKYHALIKHNYNARESEIKTIIISTHWNELIRPFSETIYRTTLALTGYIITINERSVPLTIEQVLPLERSLLSRKFSYWYGLYMFETEDQRSEFYKEFKSYLVEKGSRDFVLVEAHADLTDFRIMFPFGVILAFQKLPVINLIETIKLFDQEEYDNLFGRDEFEDDESCQMYLEGCLINALDTLGHLNESEACYPQKVNIMLNAEKWEVENIERFGVFNKDPRYDDDLLVRELSGLDGNSETAFFGVSESTQLERIKEIRKESRYSLEQSPMWLETIDLIMSNLENEKRKYRLQLTISSQSSLQVALYHTLVKKDVLYMPFYFIIIDYLDTNETELYHGSIRWNLKNPTAPYLKPLDREEQDKWFFNIFSNPNNEQSAKELNLGYTTARYLIKNMENKFQGFFESQDGKLVSQSEFMFQFEQFAVTFREQLDVFVSNFNKFYVVMPRTT